MITFENLRMNVKMRKSTVHFDYVPILATKPL